MCFSRKTLLHQDSVCFKDRGKVDVRSSSATKKSMHEADGKRGSFPWASELCTDMGTLILSAVYTI